MKTISEVKILTATEVAEMLGVSRETIYRLARSNQIPHFRVGTALRFSKEKVKEWIEIDEKGVY